MDEHDTEVVVGFEVSLKNSKLSVAITIQIPTAALVLLEKDLQHNVSKD